MLFRIFFWALPRNMRMLFETRPTMSPRPSILAHISTWHESWKATGQEWALETKRGKQYSEYICLKTELWNNTEKQSPDTSSENRVVKVKLWSKALTSSFGHKRPGNQGLNTELRNQRSETKIWAKTFGKTIHIALKTQLEMTVRTQSSDKQTQRKDLITVKQTKYEIGNLMEVPKKVDNKCLVLLGHILLAAF